MSSPVITIENLSKHFRVTQKGEGLAESFRSLFARKYKIVKAVENISFSINEGEMVGCIGPNGAGKTTTLKMLSGILYPTSGKMNVLGYIPHERKREFQRKISLVMGQKNQLWWDLPAVDTFRLNKEIYDIPDDQFKETMSELIKLLDIQEILNTQVRKLSLGERMKCELVAALLHRPKVIFLDEPTIGLDVIIQKKIRRFFRAYNEKFQATIMLTSHYMDDVKEICDRVIMIDHGKKIYDGALTSLIKEYALKKYLVIDFNEEIEKKRLRKFGEIIEYGKLRAKLAVPRECHAKIASEILEKFPVDNLDINEIELEDIITKIFTK